MPNMVIAYVDQGGLVAARPQLLHQRRSPRWWTRARSWSITRPQLFTLSGQSAEQAADSAQTVLRIETALAKASMDRTLRRDPKNRDHKMTPARPLSRWPRISISTVSSLM